jgi:hypothetical protein
MKSVHFDSLAESHNRQARRKTRRSQNGNGWVLTLVVAAIGLGYPGAALAKIALVSDPPQDLRP